MNVQGIGQQFANLTTLADLSDINRGSGATWHSERAVAAGSNA